jgi:3-hydroxyacyl-[acyl-carrier-protein] dehydratase
MIFGSKTNDTVIDIVEIMKCLPHRYPFLLIDKVVDIIPNERIVAIKNVTFNEPFFQGHFPGKPVMPGVLIIEAMAQASGILALKSDTSGNNSPKIVYFLSIESAKFRIPVSPGDVLEIHSTILQSRSFVSKFSCEVFIDGKKASEAIISAKVVVD